MKNFVQGCDSLPLAAPYAVSAGGGALIGATFGVAVNDLANAEVGTFMLEGVFTLTKATGGSTGGSAGARAYWIAADKKVTAAAGSSPANTLIGVFSKTAADGDATAEIRLNGSF